MLLTRLWIILLATTLVFAVGSLFVAGSIVERERDVALNEVLARDRKIADALLKNEARLRIDDLAAFAINDEIKQILRSSAQREPDKLKVLNSRLVVLLGEINKKLGEMDADLLFAVDQRGVIVAQLGANRSQFGSSLEMFPTVQAALGGRLRDDVWLYSGSVYRMAARPVVLNGDYVGAIVHGKRIDDAFAQKLSSILGGASVAFFRGTDILARFQPREVSAAPNESQLKAALVTALADPKLRTGTSSGFIPLDNTGRAVYTWMTGPLRSLQVGYAIGRPLQHIDGSFTLLSGAARGDVRAVPIILLIGAWCILAAIGMGCIWLERDRAMRRFEHAAEAFAKQQTERLSPIGFHGAMRRIIEAFNSGMEHVLEKKRGSRKRENLSEILGPTVAPVTGGGFFDFPKEEPTVPAGTDHAAKAGFIVPDPVSKPRPPPPPPPKSRPGTAPYQHAVALPSAPHTHPGSEAPTSSKTAEEVARMSFSSSRPSLTQEEDFAVVSEVSGYASSDRSPHASSRAPHAVIKGPSSRGQSSLPPPNARYHALYRDFMEIKTRCGEPTAGFTYEKFLAAVNKNREQIIKRHNAKDVRFTVYEKNGKAALKAKPLR
ncbi:MAG: hypothetical protein H6714_03155 [Myxococcales bacterium]|nr:hypothetical protein [Myxococcales bacterium]